MKYFWGFTFKSVTVVTPDGSGNAVLFSSIYTHYKYFYQIEAVTTGNIEF